VKLVYKYCSTDECTYSCDIFFCFEYESKVKFIFDVLTKFEDTQWEIYKSYSGVEEYKKRELFKGGPWLDKYEIDNIESSVYTLDEWFKSEQLEVVL
jgi:hypothetical protein